MNYQWYPGHMTKARRMMQEDIKLIDLVIELLDARVPFSSRNPDIDKMGRDKARLILLNKSDLADEKSNEAWVAFFEAKGYCVRKINSRSGAGLKSINAAVLEACHEKIERDKRKGIKNRPVRAMVVGIPNVGKSTFINAYAGKACAKTGNKPGVTKGKQWIRLNKGLELLDTPGILWPKFEDQSVGMRLAMIGSIKDEILNTDELALNLIRFLMEAAFDPKVDEIKITQYRVAENSAVINTLIAAKKPLRKHSQFTRRSQDGVAASKKVRNWIIPRQVCFCWMISEAEKLAGSRWNFRRERRKSSRQYFVGGEYEKGTYRGAVLYRTGVWCQLFADNLCRSAYAGKWRVDVSDAA